MAAAATRATTNKEPTVAEGQQDGQNQQEDTPEAKATEEKKATPKPDNGDSGGSIGDVPVYPGAKKTTSGEWSGSEAMIPAIGSDVDAGNYAKVQYAMYETDDSANDVFDWYKDKMSDWDDAGSFSGGSEGSVGAFGVWTKDDGKTSRLDHRRRGQRHDHAEHLLRVAVEARKPRIETTAGGRPEGCPLSLSSLRRATARYSSFARASASTMR